MELRHLRYFIAVAEEENVTRAATRLHLSQPPLTRQIRELEEELGVELFTRTAKSIHLTAAGRVFLAEARAALRRVDDAVHAVRSVGHADLQIGYAPTPTAEILPGVLQALKKTAPGVRVHLHDHSSPEMLAGLRAGRLHAAFMMQPSPAAGRGIVFEKLRAYPIAVAVPADHAWARRRGVTLKAVLAEPLLAYHRARYPDYHEFLGRIVGRAARRLHFVAEYDGGMSLLAAIESGKGLAITSTVFARTVGRRLALVPITPAPPPAVVGLARRPGRPSAQVGQLLAAARSRESAR